MDAINLTQRLLEFQSTSYNELQLAQFIAHWLGKNGVPYVIDEFNPTDYLQDGQPRPNTANVYVNIGKGPKTLLLYSHMDVVDATPDMFQPRVNGGRLIGRGAADMKSSIAGLMIAATNCQAAIENSGKRIVFAFIADEETSGTGARRHVQVLPKQNISNNDLWCILTEPTDGFRHVEIGGKGYIFLDVLGNLDSVIQTLRSIMQFRERLLSRYTPNDRRYGPALISITKISCDRKMVTDRRLVEIGRAAHASQPAEGVNALEKMLLKLSEPVSYISTAKNSSNTIPDHCEAYLAKNYPEIQCRATIDVRTNLEGDDQDALWIDLCQLLDNDSQRIKHSVRDRGKAYMTPIKESGLLNLCIESVNPRPIQQIAQGGSDAGYYALITPHVIGGFGPGEYSQLHKDSESIELSSIMKAPLVFQTLINNFIA